MSRKLKKVTQNWLEVERHGTDAAAETALSRVFRALPMPIPSAALARRTLAQLGLATGVTRRPHWAYRWAVSTALAVSGVATVLYAPALLGQIVFKGLTNSPLGQAGLAINAQGNLEVSIGLTDDDGVAIAIDDGVPPDDDVFTMLFAPLFLPDLDPVDLRWEAQGQVNSSSALFADVSLSGDNGPGGKLCLIIHELLAVARCAHDNCRVASFNSVYESCYTCPDLSIVPSVQEHANTCLSQVSGQDLFDP